MPVAANSSPRAKLRVRVGSGVLRLRAVRREVWSAIARRLEVHRAEHKANNALVAAAPV
jgi:hypothetical protein